MDYALIKNGVVAGVIVADADSVAGIADQWDHIEPASGGVGPGWGWSGGQFVAPPAPPAPPPAEPTAYEWYIDIGPFYDRFKSAKLAVLTSNDPGVRAIIADLNIRKWVDLARTDVSSAIQYVGTQVPALTAELQTEILATPVADHENLALRKLYFS